MIDKLDDTPAFSIFKKSALQDWNSAIAKELKGKNIEEIFWQNENGFTISPYSRPDSEQVVPTAAASHWEIQAKCSSDDDLELNKRILWSLNQGVNSIEINLSEIPIARFDNVLKDVKISFISLSFTEVVLLPELSNWLKNRATLEQVTTSEIRGSLHPTKNCTPEEIKAFLGEFTSFSLSPSSSVAIHNRGGNAVHELVWNLTFAHELMFSLDPAVAKETALRATFAIGNHFYTEIAKLRVFRRLWSKIAESYGWNQTIQIGAETSFFFQTALDENNNIIRSTIQAIAAISGGADSLRILPSDEWSGEWNENSARIAININHLLSEESHLNEYRNAASGSWYLRDLEDNLADRAWRSFIDWDKYPGMQVHVMQFLSEVKRTKKVRNTEVETGTRTIIGVNKYRGQISEKHDRSPVDRLSSFIEEKSREEAQ
jgi:methylmalonyl-CoA mutase